MRKFFREFKEFISRGSIMDLAVGVIIGGAFTAIVTALTGNILMPIVNCFLLMITGGKGLNQIYTYLKKAFVVAEDGTITNVIDLENSIYIDWGAFITAIITFILTALVIFLLLKLIMKAKGISASKYEHIAKDEYKKFRKEGKTQEEIAAINNERAAAKKAEDDKKAAEAAANTTESLLKDIKEILQNKK